MSYARFGSDSDVYVYSDGAQIWCCNCRIDKVPTIGRPMTPGDFRSADAGEMLKHFGEHIAAGHRIPPYALRRLEAERDGLKAFVVQTEEAKDGVIWAKTRGAARWACVQSLREWWNASVTDAFRMLKIRRAAEYDVLFWNGVMTYQERELYTLDLLLEREGFK